VCSLASRQHSAGVWLPLAVPSLRRLIESFLLFTKEQYLAIPLAQGIEVMSTHRKDHIRDMLCVHICDAECISKIKLFI
jgi:hypothetical protein